MDEHSQELLHDAEERLREAAARYGRAVPQFQYTRNGSEPWWYQEGVVYVCLPRLRFMPKFLREFEYGLWLDGVFGNANERMVEVERGVEDRVD